MRIAFRIKKIAYGPDDIRYVVMRVTQRFFRKDEEEIIGETFSMHSAEKLLRSVAEYPDVLGEENYDEHGKRIVRMEWII